MYSLDEMCRQEKALVSISMAMVLWCKAEACLINILCCYHYTPRLSSKRTSSRLHMDVVVPVSTWSCFSFVSDHATDPSVPLELVGKFLSAVAAVSARVL